MESKYTKYTIIEIVPVEIKSYRTPLFTIINSVFLWTWLIIYFLYQEIYLLYRSIKEKSLKPFKNFHKKEYITTIKHNELTEPIFINNDIQACLEDESLENFISESKTYDSKTSYSILQELLSSDDVTKVGLNEEFSKNVGRLVLRKEIIHFSPKENDILSNKVLLVRSFSKPVKLFLDFALKKVF